MPVPASSQQEFSDADWRAVAAGDQSKKLKFVLSAIAANTTRLLTMPDADVTISSFIATLLDDTTQAAARTTLGLTPGTDVQAYDAFLASIAGLTVAAGGFLRTSAADTAVAQSIVGTVSQSGGTPTGSIVETGSNANGNYTKFADGTLFCWGTTTTSASGATTQTLPATYASATTLMITGNSVSSSTNSSSVKIFNHTTTTFDINALSSADARASTPVRWIAIGRWF